MENDDGLLSEEAELNVDINGQTINVNDDIRNHLEKLDNNLSDVRGFIRSVTDCNKIFSLKNKINNGSESRSGTTYLYEIDIITFKEFDDNNNSLYVKISSTKPATQVVVPAQIHMTILDDVPSDIYGNKIVTKAQEYYDQIEVYVEVELTPFIHASSLGQKDAIHIIGNTSSSIVELITGSYCNIHNDIGGMLSEFENNPLILEQGQAKDGQLISYSRVSSITAEALDNYKVNDMESMLAFLVLHATGYNSGIVHNPALIQINGQGFMTTGICIEWRLGKWPSTCHSYHDPDPLDNLSQIVDETPPWVKDKIRDRFEY